MIARALGAGQDKNWSDGRSSDAQGDEALSRSRGRRPADRSTVCTDRDLEDLHIRAQIDLPTTRREWLPFSLQLVEVGSQEAHEAKVHFSYQDPTQVRH